MPPISQLNRVLDARPALHGRERVRPLRHDLRRRRQRGGRLRILPIIIIFIIQLELVRVAVPVVLRHVVADPPPLLPLAPPAPNRAPQRRSALPVQLARHEAAHAAPVRRARRFLHDALRLVHAVRVAVSMAVTGAVTVPVAMARTQLAVPSPILRTLLRGPLTRFRAALPEPLRHLAVELLGLVKGLVDLPDGAEDVGRDGGRGRPRGEGGRGGDIGARGNGEGARGRC